MKCMQCPLLAEDRGIDDIDVICLADTKHQSFPTYKNGFDFDNGGCRRSNKWILAQNPQKLKDEFWKTEARRWEDYLQQEGLNNAERENGVFGGQDNRRSVLSQ